MKSHPYWKLKVQQMKPEEKKELRAFLGISKRTLYNYMQKPGRVTADRLARLKHYFIVRLQQEITMDDLLRQIDL